MDLYSPSPSPCACDTVAHTWTKMHGDAHTERLLNTGPLTLGIFKCKLTVQNIKLRVQEGQHSHQASVIQLLKLRSSQKPYFIIVYAFVLYSSRTSLQFK